MAELGWEINKTPFAGSAAVKGFSGGERGGRGGGITSKRLDPRSGKSYVSWWTTWKIEAARKNPFFHYFFVSSGKTEISGKSCRLLPVAPAPIPLPSPVSGGGGVGDQRGPRVFGNSRKHLSNVNFSVHFKCFLIGQLNPTAEPKPMLSLRQRIPVGPQKI